MQPPSNNLESLSQLNSLPYDGLVVVSIISINNNNLNNSQNHYLQSRRNLTYINGQPMSLWISLDENARRLIFYDHGPTNEPYLILSLPPTATIVLTDITYEQHYIFEIHNCETIDDFEKKDINLRNNFKNNGIHSHYDDNTNTTPYNNNNNNNNNSNNNNNDNDMVNNNTEREKVNLTFSYTSQFEYWRWALSFANLLQTNLQSNSKKDISQISEQFTSTITYQSLKSNFILNTTDSNLSQKNQVNHNIVKWNNFMLDFAMDSINIMTDRNMIRKFMKKYEIKGSDLRTIKFYSIHNRIIVSDVGKTLLRLGSVIITINQISAIGLPGRSLLDILHDIPTHFIVEIYCWEFPRDMFYCNVMIYETKQIKLNKTSTEKFSSLSLSSNFFEEKKNNETNSQNIFGNNGKKSGWMTDVKIKLEGEYLTLQTKSWKQVFLLSNIRMRLVEIDENDIKQLEVVKDDKSPIIIIALHVAIEIHDQENQVLISCKTIRLLLDLLCRIFEALKLIGTIPYDLILFHEKCLQYQSRGYQTQITPLKDDLISTLTNMNHPITPISMNQNSPHLLTPIKSLDYQNTGIINSYRSEIMKAAQDLENLFQSLHVSDSFPTAKLVNDVILIYIYLELFY